MDTTLTSKTSRKQEAQLECCTQDEAATVGCLYFCFCFGVSLVLGPHHGTVGVLMGGDDVKHLSAIVSMCPSSKLGFTLND